MKLELEEIKLSAEKARLTIIFKIKGKYDSEIYEKTKQILLKKLKIINDTRNTNTKLSKS